MTKLARVHARKSDNLTSVLQKLLKSSDIKRDSHSYEEMAGNLQHAIRKKNKIKY